MSSHPGPRPDPYNEILIRLRTADESGMKLEERLSQTTANLQAVSRDLNEAQKAVYEQHRGRLACQNELLIEQRRHREYAQAYQSVQAQFQPLNSQLLSLTASNHQLQRELAERKRMSTLTEERAWFSSGANNSLGLPEQRHTLLNEANALTASNLHLQQELNKGNTAPTSLQKDFGVKNDHWRSSGSMRTSVAAGSLNTRPSASTHDPLSDKQAGIALRVAGINQEKVNLMNEHHEALCAASDRAIERVVKLQEIDLKSERRVTDPAKGYVSGDGDNLPTAADLDDDESNVLSDSEAEVNPLGSERQYKRPRRLRQLRPKDPNMRVSCG